MKKIHRNSIAMDQSGAVLPLIGLSIVLLIAFMGVAIDSGRYFLARNKLSNALDAALIAAADIATPRLMKDDPEALQKRGREYFRANFPVNYLGTNISDSDLEITFDEDSNTVSGNVQTRLPLVFGGIYTSLDTANPLTSLGMDVFSSVNRNTGGRTFEMAIAVDESGSMCNKLGKSAPFGVETEKDPACAGGGTSEKFQQVKNGVTTLIKAVDNQTQDPLNPLAAYYAYIPFTHNVSIDKSLADFNFIRPEQKTKVESAIGLTNNPETIINAINGAKIAFEGGTNTAMGLWYGWAALRPDGTSIFTGSSKAIDEANHPTDFEKVKDFQNTKVLVLLTDGANEYQNRDRDKSTEGLPNVLSGDAAGFQPDSFANDRIGDLCDAIKSQSILLCTILYDVPGATPSKASPIEEQLTSCATSGCSYTATSETALQQAFEEIANRLIDKTITQ